MNQQASQSQRINIRDFAVWTLETLGSRRMTIDALRLAWEQTRAHSTADANNFEDLTTFINQRWNACIALFRQKGLIKLAPQSNTLCLTPMGQDYLSAPDTLLATQKKLDSALTHTDLEERLLALRHSLCLETDLPPFRIFPDNLLAQLLIHRPTTFEDLEKISGMGSYKLSKYGPQLMEVLTP